MHPDNREPELQKGIWYSFPQNFWLPKNYTGNVLAFFPMTKQINPGAFHLQLITSIMVHPVFHQCLLVKEATPCTLYSQTALSPLVNGEEEYKMKAVLGSRCRWKQVE